MVNFHTFLCSKLPNSSSQKYNFFLKISKLFPNSVMFCGGGLLADDPTPVRCLSYFQCCNKCLYCNKISAKCECTAEDKVRRLASWVFLCCCVEAKAPADVMYGWCGKCREKYREEYDNLVGWEREGGRQWGGNYTETHYFSNNCTYCGGALEGRHY